MEVVGEQLPGWAACSRGGVPVSQLLRHAGLCDSEVILGTLQEEVDLEMQKCDGVGEGCLLCPVRGLALL